MNQLYRKQVLSVLTAAEIHSPTQFSWFGVMAQQLPRSLVKIVSPQALRNHLVQSLQSQIYGDFYCKGFASIATYEARNSCLTLDNPFIEELSKSNSGTGFWEDGWKVRIVEEGNVVANRAGLEIRARPKDCRPAHKSKLIPGESVSLRLPKEFLGMAPGFYMVLSNTELTKNKSQTIVRLYWNLTPSGAIRFTKYTSALLNQNSIPFKMKLLGNPTQYIRNDAVVLYVRDCDYPAVARLMRSIYARVFTHIKHSIPGLTKPIAPGVGLAEDPFSSESFGLHRSGLLAEAIVSAYEKRENSEALRFQMVTEKFRECGINLNRPYLNPGSLDTYSLIEPKGGNAHPKARAKRQPSQPTSSAVDVAIRISNRILNEAIWSNGCCGWLGYLPEETAFIYPVRLNYKALGPDVYNGTSGIALFLAELYAVTGAGRIRRTAIGAIRQSLSCVDAIPRQTRRGFYTGWVGIAFAAARIGLILRDEDLLSQAHRLVDHVIEEPSESHEYDLLSGNAGAILGLILLKEMLGADRFLDFAVKLGDEIIEARKESKAGVSWKALGFRNGHNLTGFSHGVAGIAYALLELFQATGESKYKEVAKRAFDYERFWFSEKAQNWPDFRHVTVRSSSRQSGLSFATVWCHGAPGIGLSRLRAYENLHDETCKAEGVVALATTRNMIRMALRSGGFDFSLCHGLAGNAEVLRYGSQVLGRDYSDSRLQRNVAVSGIERMKRRSKTWFPGSYGFETPGLMTGLAGVGYYFLRLANLITPSILILRREEFSKRTEFIPA